MSNGSLAIDFCDIPLKNPVGTASGCFGFGWQFEGFYDVGETLGFITCKGLSAQPWAGNPAPRIAELPSSIMNSVGLQNPGVSSFVDEFGDYLAGLAKKGCLPIVQAVGHSIQEYKAAVELIEELCPWAKAIELNVSCPNLEFGGKLIGGTPEDAQKIVKAIRPMTNKLLLVKLAPVDVARIAQVCEAEGADALSLINTISGMALNVHTRESLISRPTGGVSGPAIHAIALRMVWEAAQTVDIPINAMGGISSWEDAAEMILVGASCVSVGSANFANPMCVPEIILGLKSWVAEQGVDNISDLRGAVRW